MRSFTSVVCAGATVVALALVSTSAAAQTAASPGWRIEGVLRATQDLTAVSALSSNDAWAGGSPSAVTDRNPILLHWNGISWSQLPSPGLPSSVLSAYVTAVVGVSSTNAWFFAFGQGQINDYGYVLHWTGKSWAKPIQLPAWTSVSSAVAFGSGDVWAFGTTGTSQTLPYSLHYNGTQWTRVAIPVASARVTALSANNMWLYGERSTAPHAEVAHWNGKSWTAVPLPRIKLPSGEILIPGDGIAASSATSVWIDVLTAKGQGLGPNSYVLHWNGTRFVVVKVPYSLSAPGAMADDGSGGMWLVDDKSFYHVNASNTWAKTAVPSMPGDQTLVRSMTRIPATHSLWAAAMLLDLSTSTGIGAVLKDGP